METDLSFVDTPDEQLEPDITPEELAAVTLETQKLEKRHRQIQAQISLPFSPEQIWDVLIDYEALADFIPNLAKSERIPHPESIRIEQIGVKNALFLKFSARVVLDMVEDFPHAIRFEMVEGDFNAFAGAWEMTQNEDQSGTTLTYTLQVCPTRLIPVRAIEMQLGKDLPRNLIAIRQRLYQIYGG
ncbi:SRPBCC family protein [Acaryochloris sp. CCMEE 5410]|uniref:SRPBCC family protein n=1 Tax=Acaryochloris sp. CCMEE 5410 TaxID=310037 RepID=UPI000248501F|nr:SRPBCC family protein [Acaryochloris sp. CCMEE 5410]KAI9130504.1 SRPBCC family protein [Acaryochloris sp. CCMEE 5410]